MVKAKEMKPIILKEVSQKLDQFAYLTHPKLRKLAHACMANTVRLAWAKAKTKPQTKGKAKAQIQAKATAQAVPAAPAPAQPAPKGALSLMKAQYW